MSTDTAFRTSARTNLSVLIRRIFGKSSKEDRMEDWMRGAWLFSQSLGRFCGPFTATVTPSTSYPVIPPFFAMDKVNVGREISLVNAGGFPAGVGWVPSHHQAPAPAPTPSNSTPTSIRHLFTFTPISLHCLMDFQDVFHLLIAGQLRERQHRHKQSGGTQPYGQRIANLVSHQQ